jgi:hypothetical protein
MPKLIIILTVVVLAAFNCQFTVKAQSRPCPEPVRSAFRYVIAYNQEATSNRGETFRVIDVLMDPNSLSEGNLKQLFAMLSRSFPQSNRLFIHVHTNLEDVYTPEEANQIAFASRCDTLRSDKYPWAMYNRSATYEGFDYVQTIGEKISTIQMRGGP